MNPVIYLLDDEPGILALLSDGAELCGFETQSYTRGQDLFDEVNTFTENDILILDLHMPEMDGIEFMRRMVEVQMSPRLILISGQDVGVLHSAEKLARAHGLEVIASLTKPLSMDIFFHVLKELTPLQSPAGSTARDEQKSVLPSANLRYAIHDNQLILHYQPQFSLRDGKLTGVEALVRWNHPKLGLIFPDRFIPLAEKSSVIGALTSWVIDTAVSQAQQWQEQGLPVTVSVNISANDITSLTLPEQLAQMLATSRLDPTRLVLELTESALMGELVTSLDILTRLRLKGIELSIDDFGTGYSSLLQLHRVPFTELKIDQSFVMSMCKDGEARAIVKTCIMLGHELGMKVVAEGVETKRSFELLRELGCDRGQGYYFSRPVSAREITEVLKRGSISIDLV